MCPDKKNDTSPSIVNARTHTCSRKKAADALARKRKTRRETITHSTPDHSQLCRGKKNTLVPPRSHHPPLNLRAMPHTQGLLAYISIRSRTHQHRSRNKKPSIYLGSPEIRSFQEPEKKAGRLVSNAACSPPNFPPTLLAMPLHRYRHATPRHAMGTGFRSPWPTTTVQSHPGFATNLYPAPRPRPPAYLRPTSFEPSPLQHPSNSPI